MRRVIYADNIEALAELPDESASLVYIDPPFNTGANSVEDNHSHGA